MFKSKDLNYETTDYNYKSFNFIISAVMASVSFVSLILLFIFRTQIMLVNTGITYFMLGAILSLTLGFFAGYFGVKNFIKVRADF